MVLPLPVVEVSSTAEVLPIRLFFFALVVAEYFPLRDLVQVCPVLRGCESCDGVKVYEEGMIEQY